MIKNHLKEWRARQAQRGISKATLARRIRVNRSYVTKLEQGKAVPSLQVALLLAEYFGCTVDQLFELQDETWLELSHDDMLPNARAHED